jgi:hypothetical protein
MRSTRIILRAAMLGLVALSGPALALAGAGPPRGGLVLVVSIPGAAARDGLIRAAGGVPAGPVQTALAGFAAGPGPDFPGRLREAGAWFVLDGARIARICGLDP